MIFAETFRLALASLSANKLRSILTMLGITVGVFSVIGVMTCIGALRSNIESGLNVLGANSFQISKFPAINFSNPWLRFRNRPDISFAQSSRFKEMMRGEADVSSVQPPRPSPAPMASISSPPSPPPSRTTWRPTTVLPTD
jgi:putative ABC transport system permease protein